MKRALLLAAATLAAAFALIQSSAKAQPAPDKSTEQIITQMEQDWSMAYLTKDAAALDRVMAPEFMWSGSQGETETKGQVVDETKTGVYTCTSTHLDELKVKVYGDTAIAFGLETEQSTYKGKDSSGQYRFTDVFVRRDGVWQAVASHSSKVVPH